MTCTNMIAKILYNFYAADDIIQIGWWNNMKYCDILSWVPLWYD